tara:strand:- start:1228 stop:1833 length:606 start_codon:yes stop_codon:yes gene_type:complete
MLLTKNISLFRDGNRIFENINLSLGSGKIIGLKGKNGSGKTSLIKTILCILEPTSGSLFWKGKNIEKNLYDFYNNITYIADRTSSLKQLTVTENIKIWKNIFISKINDEQIEKILITLKLNNYKNKKTNILSLGETKKLELLRLIIENKKIWILDEPFTNLDTEAVDVIKQTFEDHRKKEGSIIFSSHQSVQINTTEDLLL